ncbi:MAG: carboxypeptidase-like regulatory domain-containing protein [Bacteroidales bacterium]|nr:carboxypeptidase-like regulatory domain-containing protein [Bacteroidales bacterium]
MRMRIFIYVLLALLSFAANAKVRVYGYITDGNREPMAYVNVSVLHRPVGTVTNDKGYYDMEVEKGDTIEYSYVGYHTVSFVQKQSQGVLQKNVRMEMNAEELSAVEVREFRRQTSGSESIDVSDVRLMTGVSGGIENLLTTMAGVNSNNELSTQYSVRGGSYDENMVYVNGIEIYRPLLIRSGQQEGLSFVNTDLVESVSFSSGGFDAQYGDKMSSVLDIKYKKPAAFEASAAVSLLGASAHVGASSKKFSQIYGVRYKTSRYLLGSLDVNGEYDPNFIDFQTFLNYTPTERWELSFLGNFSQNSYRFTPEDRKTSFGTMSEAKSFTVYFDGRERDLFRTAFGALTADYKLDNMKLGLTASVFNTDERETYDISGEYWLSELLVTGDEGESLGIGRYHEHARNSLNATVAALSHHGKWSKENSRLSWGLTFQHEDITDKIGEWEKRDSAGYSMPHDPLQVRMFYNLKSDNALSSNRFMGFVQERYQYAFLKGTLTATAGVRFNYWDFNDELTVSPRASVSFIPEWKSDWNFRFATGLYYQAPFYKELRYEMPDEHGNNFVHLNSDIKSQQTVHFIFGTDYYFRVATRPFKLTMEAYYKLAPRLTPYLVDNVTVRYFSKEESKGYTMGFDAKLFGEMLPGSDSWIGFSLMRSREDVKGDVDANGNSVGYISRPSEQRYAVTLFFQDYFPNNPKYKVHLKFVWADGLPFGPPNSERYEAIFRAPAYRRVDIGASRLLTKSQDKFMEKKAMRHIQNIWLTLEVFNLLNLKNTNSYYWVSDVYGHQYAVPNYLTGRQFNVKLMIDIK